MELETGLALALETSTSSQDFLVFVDFPGASPNVSFFPILLSVSIVSILFNIIHAVPSILSEFTISNDSEERNCSDSSVPIYYQECQSFGPTESKFAKPVNT